MATKEKQRSRQKKRVPREGPPGLPLIGHLHLFRSRARPNLFQMLTDWSEEYGNIYPLSMGGKKVYIVNGYDCISELFNNPDVSGRDPLKTFRGVFGEGGGPAYASGESWACQRRFAEKYFSEATALIEEAITDEVTAILPKLSDLSLRPFDIQEDVFRPALRNILCQVTFGKRLTGEDYQILEDALDTLFENPGPASLHYSLSLPVGPSRSIGNKLRRLKALFNKLITERKDLLTSQTSPAVSFVDKYLLMQTKEEAGAHHFIDNNMIWAVFEMFLGGANVSKNAHASVIVYLINNPEVQVRCQAELDSVLGSTPPSFADRLRLPYTRATMAECMRHTCPTPLAVPRVATKDVTIGEYDFPQGTIFLSNLYSFMMDANTFHEPNKFDPGRFLNSDGEFQRPKELAPFGVGLRACVGETMVWMELFLITSSILQRMSVSTPKGDDPPIVTTGTTGVARSPPPFRVRVQKR